MARPHVRSETHSHASPRCSPACPAASGFFHAQRHVGVGGPFDEAGRLILRQAREAAAVDRHDQVFGLQPGARGGGGVEDLHDLQPPGVGIDLDADAAEAAGMVEFAQFLGGEVVREGVVEAGDGARDRGVGELRFADRAVVLAVDPRQRFVHHARAAVGDEHALHEPGQVFGVPAPPDARRHQRQQQHDDRGERGHGRQGSSAGGHRPPAYEVASPERGASRDKVGRWRASPPPRSPPTACPSTAWRCRARAR